MHVTQIHRAWRGGLRLMSALAVHNRGLEFLMSPVVDGRTTTSERVVLEAQVCGMRELASCSCFRRSSNGPCSAASRFHGSA